MEYSTTMNSALMAGCDLINKCRSEIPCDTFRVDQVGVDVEALLRENMKRGKYVRDSVSAVRALA